MILEGERLQITTKNLREHINDRVEYILNRDIDRSGRGYYRSQIGIISDVYRKNILINDDWWAFSQFAEIVLRPA